MEFKASFVYLKPTLNFEGRSFALIILCFVNLHYPKKQLGVSNLILSATKW